jgi:hypothetical protein
MSDVYGGRPNAALQQFKLNAHLVPQSGIEVRNRLIKQQYRRIPNESPAQCDPLFLAPTQRYDGLVE